LKIDRSKKYKSILISVLAASLFYCLFAALIQLQISKLESEKKLQNAMYGNLLRSEVDRELNSLLFISNGMASYLATYQEELNPNKINMFLKDLWERSKHVRNLGVAVGSVMTYVYPKNRNSKVLGVDFRTLKDQWAKIQQAIDTRKGTLDGPLELIQGGQAIIYRYPIFINDRYWGFISTVINTDDFLNSAFASVNDKTRIFAIRTVDQKKAFYGNPELFRDKDAFIFESNVPNGKWEWAIKNIQDENVNQIIILKILSYCFSLIGGFIVYLFMRERYQLATEAMFDSLTHLPNRRFLGTKMNLAFKNAFKKNQLIALAAIDVDYFKKINDTYGHDFGDEVLKLVARTIKSSLRSGDFVSRTGGDEFIVLLDNLKSDTNLFRIAQKMQSAFQHPFIVMNTEIFIHLSIGISILKFHHTAVGQLLKEADVALYESKAQGRNTFTVFDQIAN
jgi:diguanylate cyclase